MTWAQTFNTNNAMAGSISSSMANINLSGNITQSEINSKVNSIFNSNLNQTGNVQGNSIFDVNQTNENIATTQGSIQNIQNPTNLGQSKTMVATAPISTVSCQSQGQTSASCGQSSGSTSSTGSSSGSYTA